LALSDTDRYDIFQPAKGCDSERENGVAARPKCRQQGTRVPAADDIFGPGAPAVLFHLWKENLRMRDERSPAKYLYA